MMNQIDFIASFADLLDLKLGADEARDSRNMVPALLGINTHQTADKKQHEKFHL